MDRKPQQPRYSSSSKNYNANYISVSKIDTNDIDTTYSNFSSGEYQDIIKIIQSNKILNFRNSEGETLIHAILKNPSSSLNEANVLEIIELLVHKNVSINAMNTYNQIPLHLAANKGYYDVIEYLVSLKSDFNKIDNYGNAPIHYLIDKFIVDCKEGEYFKEGNKKLKKTLKNDKYDEITENFLILSLIEEIEEYNKKTSDDKKPAYLLNKLKQMVKDYKFYKITEIEKIKDKSRLEIENIFKKHSSIPNDTEIKNVFNNLIKDISHNIYKDFKLENKQNKVGDNELINDNTVNEINVKIKTGQIDNEHNYSNKIDEFSKKIDELKKNIQLIEDPIFKLHRIVTFIYYLRHSITDNEVMTKCDNILNLFFGSEKPKFYDYDQEIDTDKICNENDITLDKRMYFIRNYDFTTPNLILEPIQLTMDTNPTGGFMVQSVNNSGSIQVAGMKQINITNLQPGLPPIPTYYKLSVFFNILSYIKKQLDILEQFIRYTDVKIYAYQYFNLNFLNEIVINITNNLIILNINYSKLEIEGIIPEIFKLNIIIEEKIPPGANKDIIDILLVQLVNPIKQKLYNTSIPVDKKVLESLKKLDLKEVLDQLQTIINKKNFFNQVNIFYKILLGINEINDNIISFVNKSYSLKYLEKYTEFIKDFDDRTKIENFVFNKFYTCQVKYPNDLNSYENTYFPTKNYDLSNLNKIKNDLMKKYKDYNFNIVYKPSNFEFKYVKVIIDLTNFEIKFDNKTENFDFDKYLNDLIYYKTGYLNILYNDNLNIVNKDTYFSTDNKFKNQIARNKTLNFKKIDDEFIILKEDIPLVSFENIKEIIQLIGFKIIDFLNTNLNNIIIRTKKKITKEEFPKKIKKTLDKTLEYIKTNEPLLKKLISEKLIIFLNSLIKIQINEEINYLLQDMIKKDLLSSPYKELKNDKLLQDLRKLYDIKLRKYTAATMLPKLLTSSGSSFLMGVKLALSELNVSTITKIGERKLLLNKCVATNKIDLLKEKLLHKINLRTLDRNGNTILNRLIDQYNEYAIKQIVILDPEISTYKNNRGQNSIEYLFDVLKSINKAYTKEQIDKRIKTYESDLQMWIKTEGTFGDIELDDSKKMIYNIILNSLYLFNESMWLILLKSPNGWNFQDKVKLIELIKNKLEYTIEEKLLIKSLTTADKNTLQNNSNNVILNNKINNVIEELQKEINNLENSTKQMEEERKKGNELLSVSNFNKLKNENDESIKQKNIEINNLKKVLISTELEKKYDDLFSYINNTSLDLINDLNIDWVEYNKLVKEIWSYYLPIIDICNNKNNNSSIKYISYYNYSLLNLDYKNLNNEEIIILVNYYTKIINNLYSDFYDLEKYEDSEFNYINDTILNIIYINVVNVIAIEMYSGIIGYNIDKYVDNRTIKELIDNYNYKDPKLLKIFDVIINLLKTIVWDKLNKKNPNYPKNYNDYLFYSEELKTTIVSVLLLTENDADKQFIDDNVKFYKGLVENISYNVYSEIVNLLNDMKKNALLFSIYNIIKDKK